ncbi:MAG: signal recognition particle protein [Alphaproteobacteria bacterium]|jgi:signal recognition particle subunit SRP54|nr:signal recognition particle protein [Alphaproteobacteria bacterium]|tara:strand:+ start:2347 stop:3753 length:1407 start_codon:yes stop_codon:yes gene_type:complete
MFDSLSDKLVSAFDKIRGKGSLSESDIASAMKEVRLALIDADVALDVVKKFIDDITLEAKGQQITKSIKPDQMVFKIVQDKLTDLLGGKNAENTIKLSSPPSSIMLVGLQGSGKTTSAAKMGLMLKGSGKKVLLASLDVQRPAAMEQLQILGDQTNIDVLPIEKSQGPVEITKRSHQLAKLSGYDVVILDTAGRTSVDDELMDELSEVYKTSNPSEVFLVADAMTGQEAANVARSFKEKSNVTSIILTRVDGDARGGAALSMSNITNCPIKFMGTGEKLEAFETFKADRIASRILGMGDVVSLVEKAQSEVKEEEAKDLAKKISKGTFDFNDFRKQLNQMKKMGGMQGILSLLPGAQKIKKQMAVGGLDDKILVRMDSMISSMTSKERVNPKLLNGSRKRRIAEGSGNSVQDLNRLLKQFKQMTLMMKKMGKKGGNMDISDAMNMQGMDMPNGLPKGFNPGSFPFRRR